MFDRFGDFDLVLLAFGVLGDQEEAEHDGRAAVEIVEVNYLGAVSVAVPLAQRMREQGHGTIVVLSSVAGERARRSNFVYGSSKAGMDAFFQGLGDSLVGTGVQVMIVRPGFVHTKMTEGMDAAPLSTTPEAVADAIVHGLARGRETVWVPVDAALRDVGAAPRAAPGVPQAAPLIASWEDVTAWSSPRSSPRSTSTARCRARDNFVPFLRRRRGHGRPRPKRSSARRRRAAAWPVGRSASRNAVKARVLAAAVRRPRRRPRSATRSRSPSPMRCSRATSAPRPCSELDWHRTQGHRLVIVSASFGAYLRPIAERLRFDAVLATELEVGPDGRLTGRIAGANVRGAEKARRLDAWLDGAPRRIVWAYGDSSGDRELLGAGRPRRAASGAGRAASTEYRFRTTERAGRSGSLARMSEFLDALRERVLVFDGAFGTWVQGQDLGPDDFGGAALEGCNENLVLTRPDLIAQMHDEFFAVGVDAVETATFGAFPLVLDEYGIADADLRDQRARPPRIAKEVAAELLDRPTGPGS